MIREENKKLQKLVVILGPTASGKSSWSLKFSEKIPLEVISADSRQIYKYMNIGTAKEKGEWRRNGIRKTFFVGDVAHHNIDFLNPGKKFTVAEFRDRSIKYIKLAHKNNKIPFLVGGTGLYISSVVDNFHIPKIEENKQLRKSFETKSNEELLDLLRKIDPKSVENIDTKNKRRITRALEVAIISGESFIEQRKKGDNLFDTLQIGVLWKREELYKRINDRIDSMIENGLLEEINFLLKKGYSWNLNSMNGIGYRQFKDYFEGKEKLEDAVERLKRDTRRFAKRQITWFKRDSRIKWFETFEEAQDAVNKFLEN